MLGTDFYFAHIKKYVAVFGTLFNDIVIYRDEGTGPIQEIKVPISYGPRDKTLARVEADPNLNKPVAIVLPRMSFEITSFNYSPSRKLQTLGMKTKGSSTNANRAKRIYNPVPYDIGFTLSVMVKNAEDGTKIVEQILPYFTPDFTPTVRLIPEMDIEHDVPIILNNIQLEDMYEGNFEQRRAIIWTLSFTMKAYIYGPIRDNSGGNVIKFAQVNQRTWSNSIFESVSVQPGLTANGQPTTDISQSINRNEIEVTDDFGFIVQVEDAFGE